MHWYHLVYILIIFLTILAVAFLAVYSFKHRDVAGSRSFARLARGVWENTFDAVPDLIAVIDKNYRIIRANRAMADALGVSQEELVGAACFRIMHIAESPVDACPHRMLMEDGKPHNLELYEPNLRGHYLVSASPLYNDAGDLQGSVHVARNITDRKIAEIALKEKTRVLAERMKELSCLYGISEIVRRPGISLDEIMQEAAKIIPAAWQYPDIACARITLNAQTFQSIRCGESPWRQAADLVVNGQTRGMVEVFYLEEREASDEGPFLWEERALINAIAERLGRVIERRWATNDLRLSESRLDALHTMNNRRFTDEKELIQYALEEEVRLTGSEIGYFHFVKEDRVSLELFAWSSRVMETCTAAADRHYPLDLAGVWADCARTGRPAVHNDYANSTGRKGYPEGHSPIIRHASVPIFDGDRIVAISGVANKPGPYNEPDIRQMQLFMDGVWKIVMRKRAEEALAQAQAEKDTFLEKLEASEAALRERNQKMEFDLMLAQSAQKAFVRSFKPESGRLAIDFRYKPMDKVGGDYFSFFKSDDGTISFFIGDVSGHGVAAALYTALLKSITDRVHREYSNDPARYLKEVNSEIVDYILSNFITAVYGIFSEGEDGALRLRFSNGGHIKPILVRSDGECRYEGKADMLIGVTDKIDIDINEVTLGRGDRVFLVTDGIPETINDKREMIGFEQGLLDLFTRCQSPGLGKTLDRVIEETTRFRNGLSQHDDITIIGFEVL
jgi:PAS domain S-box-containing protein